MGSIGGSAEEKYKKADEINAEADELGKSYDKAISAINGQVVSAGASLDHLTQVIKENNISIDGKSSEELAKTIEQIQNGDIDYDKYMQDLKGYRHIWILR